MKTEFLNLEDARYIRHTGQFNNYFIKQMEKINGNKRY